MIKESVIQFPDLTEVLYESGLREPALYKTEFVFYLAACTRSPLAVNNGFTLVSSMNNWWPSHGGEERQMNLYWLRNPNKTEPQVSKPLRWGDRWVNSYKGTSCEKHLSQTAASGCGFKIGQLPFKAELYNRFFTLMRLPLVLSTTRQKWLIDHHYKPLDTGSMAQYWINGWDPKEHSFETEYEHFKITRADWKVEGSI